MIKPSVIFQFRKCVEMEDIETKDVEIDIRMEDIKTEGANMTVFISECPNTNKGLFTCAISRNEIRFTRLGKTWPESSKQKRNHAIDWLVFITRVKTVKCQLQTIALVTGSYQL